MKRYGTGNKLLEAGVVSGYDSTTEAAVTKLMFLFGHKLSTQEVKDNMNCSLIGEITIPKKKDENHHIQRKRHTGRIRQRSY